ncbi:MAG: type III pantothenate kinase [Planctomycetales bacterium]|nr:type III pantothenate kinase [Planctomycetales bacterium]
MPPLLTVDIGNSSTKVGWFVDMPAENGELPVPSRVRDCATAQPLPETVARELPAEGVVWRVASVHREAERLLENWVRANRSQDNFKILTYRDLPLEVRVEFPERVGLDRLAAAVAAKFLASGGRQPPDTSANNLATKPVIVVDAGTAITVDLVSADGAFEGGVILPGFRLTAQALAAGTNQLPLASFTGQDQPPPVVGKNTDGAIRSGLFWGAVGAVREVIERMSASLPQQPHIFVTGGDLRHLAPLVSPHSQFVPNMVLSGIAIASQGERGASAS